MVRRFSESGDSLIVSPVFVVKAVCQGIFLDTVKG